MDGEVLLRLEVGLQREQRLLDVRRHDPQQPHPLDVLQTARLLTRLLELQRVERLVELVYLRFYL